MKSDVLRSMTARAFSHILTFAAFTLFATQSVFALTAPTLDATATGTVTTADGQPLQHAVVMVYSAGVKKGYSIYCPTCWVDCGKHVLTDARGTFSIAGLNPELKFRLLAVKEGFTAVFIDDVDPAVGSGYSATLKPKVAASDPSQALQGRVVDGSGNPVPYALVEPDSVEMLGPNGTQMMFGKFGWLEPLTVTNERGEFEVAHGKAVIQIGATVSARAMAPRRVTLLPGSDPNLITVAQGSIVQGRILDAAGKPVPDVEVGLRSHSPAFGQTFAEVQIGTRPDGTFEFTNVPPGHAWYVYPKMRALAGRHLAAPSRICETQRDGQVVNVGNFRLQRAYELRGRVVLPDAASVAPDMHVTLESDWGDVQMAVIAPDGSFSFNGLPMGVYNLMPGVRGYLTPDNSEIEVLVDRDRNGLLAHMVTAHKQ